MAFKKKLQKNKLDNDKGNQPVPMPSKPERIRHKAILLNPSKQVVEILFSEELDKAKTYAKDFVAALNQKNKGWKLKSFEMLKKIEIPSEDDEQVENQGDVLDSTDRI